MGAAEVEAAQEAPAPGFAPKFIPTTTPSPSLVTSGNQLTSRSEVEVADMMADDAEDCRKGGGRTFVAPQVNIIAYIA